MSSPAAADRKQRRRPPASVVLALAGIGLVLLAVGAAGGARLLAPPHPAATHAFGSPLAVAPPVVSARPTISGAQIESRTFHSDALGRDMPYEVFLPPGYDSQRLRYGVVYMLHGMSGNHKEWELYGVFEVAERMMLSGEIEPFLVVLPQGDIGYWVDHANGGPAWGRYMAQDVVSEIDSRYRTVARADHRAIGGLSMGADGALQLSLNYPGEFGAVQADSPVLRPYRIAAPYYGDQAYWEAHYPVTLVASHPALARAIAISIDVGDADPWRGNAEAFHDELTSLGITHSWHEWPGGHSGPYWATHLPDYLRFYGSDVGPPLPASNDTGLTGKDCGFQSRGVAQPLAASLRRLDDFRLESRRLPLRSTGWSPRRLKAGYVALLASARASRTAPATGGCPRRLTSPATRRLTAASRSTTARRSPPASTTGPSKPDRRRTVSTRRASDSPASLTSDGSTASSAGASAAQVAGGAAEWNDPSSSYGSAAPSASTSGPGGRPASASASTRRTAWRATQ